ncbi:Serine/threonine kinase [Ascosphaera pollenicola]|nr:Serine/threonine kinase [Ascosphaera pollenicola]
MDAGADGDSKLQRASGSLLEELRTRLPSLLYKNGRSHDGGESGAAPRRVHRWSQPSKTERLITLLEPFQEWPQLLDPHLLELLTQLVDAFLAYVLGHSDVYCAPIPQRLARSGKYEPLPRTICRLIYVLCKVRGVKVISRFFNNEPKYLEPMLRAFMQWDAFKTEVTDDTLLSGASQAMNWQERYVMLLWISHLLLAPFPLKTLSTESMPIPYDNSAQLPSLSPDIPYAALPILSICLRYIPIPGKEREAATLLLARLALRLDMQQLGLLQQLNKWALNILRPQKTAEEPSVYACIGVLSFVYRLYALGQAQDLAPLLLPIFTEISNLTEGTSPMSEIIRYSSSSRKIIIKILRTITTLVLTLENTPKLRLDGDVVSSILENAIDYFLVSLADADTPVRLAASKALSLTALKLDSGMASDVIEAVIGSLDENILYETEDGNLITPYEARSGKHMGVKRNVSAVDPLRWQGLVLTLAHLLFCRSTPTVQLPDVFRSLMAALNFEQRSSTGTSVGTGVRDAANFGIWALSRKYSTRELMNLKIAAPELSSFQGDISILQILAIQLVCAGCLDPSGNIRRGSSAALQELIGRHPDTICEGIPLVQAVDYHSVARRSRAMINVSTAAAALHPVYWAPLLDGLLDWRGIRSPDAQSRRVAGEAIGKLATQNSFEGIAIALEKLTRTLSHTSLDDTETRHGLYLAISATIKSFITHSSIIEAEGRDESYGKVVSQILDIWKIFGNKNGPSEGSLTLSVMRPDLMAEAAALLISSLSQAVKDPKDVPADGLAQAAQVLLLCVLRTDETAVKATSQACSDSFGLFTEDERLEIVKIWVDDIRTVQKLDTGRGIVSALGPVFKHMAPSSEGRSIIVKELLRCTEVQEEISKRVASVKCLTTGCLPHMDNIDSLLPNLARFLNDYTTDRRGDIGSLIRLEALESVATVLKAKGPRRIESLCPFVVRLAVEKLDKVRYQAWSCLQLIWQSSVQFPPLERTFSHFSETSSAAYFLQILHLSEVPVLRPQLFKGLATSATMGSESLIKASRYSLLEYMRQIDDASRTREMSNILGDLMAELYTSISDDRYALPIVELIAFILNNSEDASLEPQLLGDLFVAVQKSHLKSASIPRIEAAVKVYGALWRIDATRGRATKKLRGMLLHPYPRVRNVVADLIFMETGLSDLKNVDWVNAPASLKTLVNDLRIQASN